MATSTSSFYLFSPISHPITPTCNNYWTILSSSIMMTCFLLTLGFYSLLFLLLATFFFSFSNHVPLFLHFYFWIIVWIRRFNSWFWGLSFSLLDTRRLHMINYSCNINSRSLGKYTCMGSLGEYRTGWNTFSFFFFFFFFLFKTALWHTEVLRLGVE